MSQKDILNMMINIMEIQCEPESIAELKKWIQHDGIDNVLKKIIHMYSLNL